MMAEGYPSARRGVIVKRLCKYYQASACVTCVNSPLTKASYMPSLSLRGGEIDSTS